MFPKRGLSQAGQHQPKFPKTDQAPCYSAAAQSTEVPTGIRDSYVEEDPTVVEWLAEHKPTAKEAWSFFVGFFPFVNWIGRYNRVWFAGDVIAGVTVGTVVVPQSMAYASLALLPPEYGLYSSFVGVLLYWFFATSKDITIGPVAVMSTLVGNIIVKAQAANPSLKAEEIGPALALVSGSIVFLIGLFRLGFIVDYIPLPAIAAFMTGSALNIAVGQVPGILGIRGFSTRESTYKVFMNTLMHLDGIQLDAALGLSALFLLYSVRWVCTSWALYRFPKWSKTLFFISTLRTSFTLLLYTTISWFINMNRRDNPVVRIVGRIPGGLQHLGPPKINREIISSFASELPATVIVLLIEHIAISKSFGRLNNYTINPSQELIAIGFTNIFGPFIGAYPATGSFSRTAIKSKAGVRTPFAGVITAIIVLLAIYALTSVFFYIPHAALSAVIIHAVGDLITPPATVHKFWMINPIEVFIFVGGVLVTIFQDIETGIYVTIAATGAMLLFRISKAQGQFLGKVRIHSIVGYPSQSVLSSPQLKPLNLPAPVLIPYPPSLCGSTEYTLSRAATPEFGVIPTSPFIRAASPVTQTYSRGQMPLAEPFCLTPTGTNSGNVHSPRNIFLPIDYKDGTNPSISIISPYPGVFIYRFSEGLVYSNAAHYTDFLVAKIQKWTKPGLVVRQLDVTNEAGDRPWNDLGLKKSKQRATGRWTDTDDKPTLKAIILDFSSVNNVDITSVQNLIDVRNQLDRYANPEKVEWHFAAIRSRWTKRALVAGGFGIATSDNHGSNQRWQPVFSVAEIGEVDTTFIAQELIGEQREEGGLDAVGYGEAQADSYEEGVGLLRGVRVVPVSSVSRPFFHPDIEGALRSAIHNIEQR